MGAITTAALGVNDLRNRFGTGHGPSTHPAGLGPRHAHLAVSAATMWCEFMLDTLADPTAPWRRHTEQEQCVVTGEDWPGVEASYPVAHVDAMWVPGDIDEGDYFRRNGYLEAARVLIHSCDKGAGRHLLLPALGCYRQYFELQLKALARVGRALRAEGSREKFGHVLDIEDITATLVYVKLVEGGGEQQAKALARRDLTDLRKAITELNRIDPRGVTFRYAHHGDTERTPTIAEGFWLDLPAAVAMLEAGAAIAESADAHLGVWRSNYADYLADMAALEADYTANFADMVADYEAGP